MKGKHKSLDRISALPQDTIEKILTLMPLKDALRTSILSRKWRYSWTTIPKLVFNDNMIVSSRNMLVDKYKFVSAIFHVFLQRTAPILEFSLLVTTGDFSSEIDQIILHLSRRNKNIKKFKFVFRTLGTSNCLLPRSIFSLQGLEHLHLSYCKFEPPLLNTGFRMLKSLHLCKPWITNEMVQRFLIDCPLLEKFTWTEIDDLAFERSKGDWVELLKCLPSVQILELSPLIIAVIPNLFCLKHLDADDMPQKHAISLPNLRILVFHIYVFLELSFVLIYDQRLSKFGEDQIEGKYHMCWDHDEVCPKNDLPDIKDYTGLNLDHLKEIEITSFNNHDLEMDFVKLIMANSPVLKKARLEINSDVSVDEEVKMLRDLMHIPFLRASPITIERPKDD
ncbi:hypothetical protein LXL04_011167 [Taraxacum kok-saghyz]